MAPNGLLSSSLVHVLLFSGSVHGGSVAHKHKRESQNTLAPYAPSLGLCPSTSLLRDADGIGASETAWLASRKPQADTALQSWLSTLDGTFSATEYPTIGSAVGGGFLRASLLGAGIHQALDSDEGTGPMAGLLQAISYESALSGSAAYISGLLQNNWPTIASLAEELWVPSYQYGMKPGAPDDEVLADTQIVADVAAKTAAGHPLTLIDIYGRIIGWGNLEGTDGGVSSLMSDARTGAKFAAAQVPFPLFTSTGVVETSSNCVPGTNGLQYEFTPFEFGSWDSGVASFIDMEYLGTSMYDGEPTTPLCTTGYDNLGFLIGMSANVLAWDCTNAPSPLNESIFNIDGGLAAPVNRVYYGTIPNPFQGKTDSPSVSNSSELNLADGGNTFQVIPMWPLLHRPIDVTFVWDNYYDINDTFTTGGQIYNTWLEANKLGLVAMPEIPPPATMDAMGLNTHPVAFGCNNEASQTLIYVPFREYVQQTYNTTSLTIPPDQVYGSIENGNRLADYNGTADWPECVGCLIMKKSATSLPDYCTACFTQYCYN